MKIRNGFVSNSSSSSFIMPNKYTEKQIKEAVKEYLRDYIHKRIEEQKETRTLSNWQEYIKWLEEDLQEEVLDREINVLTVKQFQEKWDLAEWFDLSQISDDDLILFDEEDNFINRVSDDILKDFEIKQYCLHMG